MRAAGRPGYSRADVGRGQVRLKQQHARNGDQHELLRAGAVCKPCFCGPCFGAGDVPANDALSIRHTTRNFPNREGSKPGDGQLSGVILMDARSIAATARNHGVLTSAADVDYDAPSPAERRFDASVYDKRVYRGFGHPQPDTPLQYGPNIAEWPAIPALSDDLLLQVASVLRDEVTTTDELIPSGETSSYRSNPMKLAQFTLSRRDPDYVPRAKAAAALESARTAGEVPAVLADTLHALGLETHSLSRLHIGSVIFANKPGDGSAREQAASCQRVLGGSANICYEFATKRYRSNVMNWGMVPFQMETEPNFEVGDYVFVPGIRAALDGDLKNIAAYVVRADGAVEQIELYIADMTAEERAIVKAGCLINYNKFKAAAE